MERNEFCQMLVKSREQAGISKNEMCRRTGLTFARLQLIEAKPNNFIISKPIQYLNAIGCVLCLVKGSACTLVQTEQDVAMWLKESRKNLFSQRTLAQAIGCSYLTIANIERGKTTITIDTLLKIVNALGYTISIKSKDGE